MYNFVYIANSKNNNPQPLTVRKIYSGKLDEENDTYVIH